MSSIEVSLSFFGSIGGNSHHSVSSGPEDEVSDLAPATTSGPPESARGLTVSSDLQKRKPTPPNAIDMIKAMPSFFRHALLALLRITLTIGAGICGLDYAMSRGASLTATPLKLSTTEQRNGSGCTASTARRRANLLGTEQQSF